ncbi:Glucosamine-6-phosphate deaminase [Candidatus Hepatoplasma crinochetorum Av]|uniref:Glucosamine-6-phosphate deaminase n=1 Tax=Candidatus Hepatoplasma crinochetorum Av TaxID=1427984 RepID=W8GF90_9MOLU|nr:hypothetical protein [Candidatus Hepatoplasma crinochetorum]AHK22424.1 Glucosamine-6-phosphate deaminase [Candidatus Hepatoplasma crinochetorum Av]
MKIIRSETNQILDIISTKVINIIKEKEDANLLITSEKELISLYQQIVNKYQNQIISFVQSKVFILSEYINSIQEKVDSLNKIIDNNLIKKIDIKQENFHFPKDVYSYNQIINNISFFDFTLLYLDDDFKISFNHLDGKLINQTKIIGLSDRSIRNRFKEEKDHPHLAITMGIKDIFYKSKEINLLILGNNKKQILNKIENKKKNDSLFLKFLLNHQNITIFTDIR